MKYTVEVGEKSFEVEIDAGRITVDGRPVDASLGGPSSSALRRFKRGTSANALLATPGDEPGSWVIGFKGCRLPVQVLNARARAMRAAGTRIGAQAAAGTLRAPMPGLVLRVLVAEGAAVEGGQGLVVIEAMKMENEIKALGAATVARVLAKPGDRVEKGAPLLELT